MADDVLQFGREILHDEACALDALAESLDGPFEAAVELILQCSGKLIVNMAGETFVFPLEDARAIANPRSDHQHPNIP